MEFLTNILSGGVLGVFTSAFSTWFKFKQQAQNNEFKLNMIKAQSDASIQEAKAQIEVSKVVTEGNERIEEAKADTAENIGRASLIEKLTGNYLSDNTLHIMLKDTSLTGKIFRPFIYLHLLFMDAVRGLIRPVLTVGIIYYVTYITGISLDHYLHSNTGMDGLMHMVIHPAIQLILFSASTVIAFWYSDKAMSRRYQKGVSDAS